MALRRPVTVARRTSLESTKVTTVLDIGEHLLGVPGQVVTGERAVDGPQQSMLCRDG